MKLAVPDLISPSYFPPVAAVEQGFFEAEGLDVEVETASQDDKAYAALRDRPVEMLCVAAQALEARLIDGFWANGMGAEVAVRRGAGTLVLDVRRGDGPASAFHFTFSAVAAADRLIAAKPTVAAAAVRAVANAQAALRE